jgi:hypothetical protein
MDVVLHLMFLVVGLGVLWKSAELLVCGGRRASGAIGDQLACDRADGRRYGDICS